MAITLGTMVVEREWTGMLPRTGGIVVGLSLIPGAYRRAKVQFRNPYGNPKYGSPLFCTIWMKAHELAIATEEKA